MTAKEYKTASYARTIIPDPSGGYFAEVLEFPGCFAQGHTVDEAFSNLEKVAESWIAVALANGQTIPEPSNSVVDYQGRILLRLPRSLHLRAIRMAQRDHISLNELMIGALATELGTEDLRWPFKKATNIARHAIENLSHRKGCPTAESGNSDACLCVVGELMMEIEALELQEKNLRKSS